MKKPMPVLVLLLAPLAVMLPRDVAAQEPMAVYQFRHCARLGIAFAPGDTLVVERVRPGSPAARAGIRPADRLVTIDGTKATEDALPSLMEKWRPGVPVRLRVERQGAVREVDVAPAPDVCVESVRGPQQARAFSGQQGLAPAGVYIYRRGDDSLHVWTLGADSAFLELIVELRTRHAAVDSLFRSMRESEMRRLDSLRQNMLRVQREWVTEQQRLARDMRSVQVSRGEAGGRVAIAAPFFSEAGMPVVVRIGQHAIAGVEFTELEPQLAEYFKGATQGLLVLRVAPNTPGARAGLQPGDVVMAANDEPIHGIVDLRTVIAHAGREPVTLSIVRRGKEQRLVYRYDD